MIEIQNEEIFGKVIADALVRVDQNHQLPTWEKTRHINAIAKAARRIQEQGCFMDWDGDADQLLIWSQGTNLIYIVGHDGRCQCRAQFEGKMCWHRAAKRIVELYNAEMLKRVCTDADFRAAIRAADAMLAATDPGDLVRYEDIQIIEAADA
jgi:hypothetical protein